MIATKASPAHFSPSHARQIWSRSALNTSQSFTSFPKQYSARKRLHGLEITFRAIQPEDESLLLEFHKTVSDQSVRFRYFGAVSLRQRTVHERLRRTCAIDNAREFALIADLKDAFGAHQILGVARLFKDPWSQNAEFAILISDSWQGKGIGTTLLRLLISVGRESHLRWIVGHILADNSAMVHVCRKVGFSLRFIAAIGEWRAEVRL